MNRYVDMESKGNIEITSALHALNIMKIHLPKASLKLTISLLEMIADRFSGDPKVFPILLLSKKINYLSFSFCLGSGALPPSYAHS